LLVSFSFTRVTMSFTASISTGTAVDIDKPAPKTSRFYQQKLPAWKPLYGATTVLPIVFTIGIACIGIGVALVLASSGVQEHFFKYDKLCADQGPNCLIHFTIDSAFSGDVFFYYYLQNYHQNTRQYIKSRNDEQLLGNLQKTSGCDPYDREGDLPIVPCGAIANSIFNDTYEITWSGNPVPLTTDGILWDVGRFANPSGDDGGDLCSRFKDTAKPPAWPRHVCEIENGLENVDLNVWMRTAALPNFRKPWRKLNRSSDPAFADGLPAGEYQVTITNQYEVAKFDGDKGFVISTTSWAGGKNNFLGVAYLVVGGVIVLIGIILIGMHARFGHSMAELADIGE
ncbi:hypothetical protein PENTCL1PPCAC_16240, partial [Pristionchus entomophagus]